VRSVGVAPLALLGLLTSCRSMGVLPGEGVPREWFSGGISSIDRRGADEGVVDDALGFTIEGGYDLILEPVRAGLELGVTWSFHDMADAPTSLTDDGVDVARYLMGGRVTVDLPPLNSVVYVRSGFYHRDQRADQPTAADADGRGTYVGGGLDFWIDGRSRMGPFLMWYEDDEQDLQDLVIGLSATFYF
jgi:hypothetical protein